MKENVRRYLAFYSIVNTIVEYSNYDYVQIFIDRDGTGSGSPITNEECGLSGEESIEPKGRNGSIILNEENTMREVMNSLESKDWSRLYDFIAYKWAEMILDVRYKEPYSKSSLILLSNISHKPLLRFSNILGSSSTREPNSSFNLVYS